MLASLFCQYPQGDDLGVEFATGSHRNYLKDFGLLPDHEELRSDKVFRGDCRVQGLVIDDFYAVGVVPTGNACDAVDMNDASAEGSALPCFRKAQAACQAAGLLGSSDKDIVDECKAKVTGCELDSSPHTRSLGLTLLAAPAKKRLALAFLSLELCTLKYTTDALHSCLVGGWTHALMYRRPFMSIPNKSYALLNGDELDADAPKVLQLPRNVAEELVLPAVLSTLPDSDKPCCPDG